MNHKVDLFFFTYQLFSTKNFRPFIYMPLRYPKGKGRSGKKKFTPYGKKVYAVQNPRLWPKAVGRDTKSFKFWLNLFFLFCRGVRFSSRRIVGRGSGSVVVDRAEFFRLAPVGKRSEGATEFFRLAPVHKRSEGATEFFRLAPVHKRSEGATEFFRLAPVGKKNNPTN